MKDVNHEAAGTPAMTPRQETITKAQDAARFLLGDLRDVLRHTNLFESEALYRLIEKAIDIRRVLALLDESDR